MLEWYAQQWDHKLPSLGCSKENQMLHSEFIRLKAQYWNNISAGYFALKQYSKAELYNNQALIIDPTYQMGFQRKCEILEELGRYNELQQIQKHISKEFEVSLKNDEWREELKQEEEIQCEMQTLVDEAW